VSEVLPASFVQLACAHLGVLPFPLAASVRPDEVLKQAERVEARGVFTTAAGVPALAGRAPRLLSLREDGAAPSGSEPLETAWRGSDAAARELLGRRAADRRSDELYMLQPTSGTTGNFNIVMRTNLPILHSAGLLTVGFRAEQEPPVRLAMTQPLTHGPGNYDLVATLLLAGEAIVPSRLDREASLSELREFDPMIVGGPARVLQSLYDQYLAEGGEAKGRWFGPSVATLTSGAAAIDVEVLRLGARQGIDVVELYGMNETGLIAVTERGKWREGYVGQVLPEVTLKTAPDGELLVQSPWRMLGYFGDPELTAARMEDGFFHTGDYCQVNAEGLLRYLGRKKDVFNTPLGYNIHPARIEALIEQHPWARQAALVGDQRAFVVALIVIAPGAASGAPNGYLDPARHPEAYAAARADLARLNAQLEQVERVVRFALFDEPFGDALYATAGQGKITRNRPAILARFEREIAALYAPDAPRAACLDESPAR
jgi:long-subunit acyl-CoA synthetase (AMP-forming)